MANLRQSIIVRTDLGFPTGLLCAQVAHTHFEPIRQKLLDENSLNTREID